MTSVSSGFSEHPGLFFYPVEADDCGWVCKSGETVSTTTLPEKGTSGCLGCLSRVYFFIVNLIKSIFSCFFSGSDEVTEGEKKEELYTSKVVLEQKGTKYKFIEDFFLRFAQYGAFSRQEEFDLAGAKERFAGLTFVEGKVSLSHQLEEKDGQFLSHRMVVKSGGELLIDETKRDGLFLWESQAISARLKGEKSIYVADHDLKKGDHEVARGALASTGFDNPSSEQITQLERVFSELLRLEPSSGRVVVSLEEGKLILRSEIANNLTQSKEQEDVDAMCKQISAFGLEKMLTKSQVSTIGWDVSIKITEERGK